MRAGLATTATWGYPAYALFGQPGLIQPVSLFGIVPLNLAILVINWTVALLALAALGHQHLDRRRVVRTAGVVTAAAAAWVGVSLVLLDNPEASLRVAAVQPGTAASVKGSSPLPAHYEAATSAAARRGARLVVWPEYGLSFDPKVTATAELRALAARTDIYIAVGYGVYAHAGNRNEAVIVTPDGRFLGPYAKHHPVTLLGETSISRHGFPVYETELGRLATIICYDLDFTGTARSVARRGAQVVAVPSADWGSIADKHYTHLVFRAIETRMSMVKADQAWDSVIIDPYGRIRARSVTPEGDDATLIADVPLGSGRSLAVSTGDWFGRLLVAVPVLVAVLRRRGPRRRDGGP